MTRIGAIADVHLGNHKRFGGASESSLNARARHGLDVFRRAVATARAEQCSALVVLGDLFDTSRPEPQLTAAVQRVVEPEPGVSDMKFWFIVGNHEQVSSSEGDHALGPLAPLVEVVEKPCWTMVGRALGGESIALGLVPFRKGKAASWLTDAIEEVFRNVPAGVRRVLGLHLGIADKGTAEYLKAAPDAIDVETLYEAARRAKVRAVFAGNWHDRRRWDIPEGWPDVTVLQLGALVPTGFDNPGMHGYGTLAIFDDKADDPVTFKEIPGPRFVKLASGQSLAGLTRSSGGNTVYVSATATSEAFSATSAALARAEAEGKLAGAEVFPDATETLVAARSAASAAKAAGTLDEALAGFVEDMPLAEGVDRADVLARSQRYLKRGRP